MILKLKGFEADADILGRILPVKYSGDTLSVVGVSLDEAREILGALSRGVIKGVSVGGISNNNNGPHRAGVAPAVVSETPVEIAVPAAMKTWSVTGEVTSPRANSEGTEAPQETTAAPPETGESAGSPQDADAKVFPEQPQITSDDIKDCKRLRDVVSMLHERGCPSVSSMTKLCESMRADVPLLSKIENIEERIRRTASALGVTLSDL